MLLQEQGGDNGTFHVVNFLVLVLYIVIKEITIPLMKRHKETSQTKDPIFALKVDLEKVQASVIDLDKEFDSTSKALDNKLDIILDELKSQRETHEKSQETLSALRERMSAVEAILKRRVR